MIRNHICNVLKRYFLLFALCLISASYVYAQEMEEPDYHKIRQATSNSRGLNYYPSLMKRFVANDTTLTLEQYRNLYYGYTLQEDFVPYKGHKKQLVDARKRFTDAKADGNMAPDMIRIAQSALDDQPFDILAMNIIALSYLQIGDTTQFRVWDIKKKGIIDAILSSGDGIEQTSAFHVIDIEHEYEVLHQMGLTVEKDSLITDQIEYLKVKKNAEDEQGFYFNFGACRNIYKKKYE